MDDSSAKAAPGAAPSAGDAAGATPTVRDVPDRGRFEVLVGDQVAGAAHYLDVDAVGGGPGRERIFFHTVVEDGFSGQGLAGRLVRSALEETVRSGLGIVPVCPFVKTYVGRHPEYRPSTRTVRGEHLQALADR
ncbi:GNAT family N-acetyltransferase [Kineococcus rhizosphaerae]|uniref:N-acetyltransferase domain-containing protein n=1 Tax=Kineococcus rhizosphaerae TaxID=559628 RepID=A0A2T0R2B5_9ACTN|nr:GNAT family N-acetyltransferase [Kineococcus rhizosphaerae]PRY13920.1 hypothetical protein CLV37_10738 [Kineococcus rhizosphaerae]